MKNYLVKWSTNWADEMNIEGFVVMNETVVADLKEVISKINSGFSIGVGTNEEIEYDNGRELLKELTFSVINDQEIETLKKFFGDEEIEDYELGVGHTGFTCLLDSDFTEDLFDEDD